MSLAGKMAMMPYLCIHYIYRICYYINIEFIMEFLHCVCHEFFKGTLHNEIGVVYQVSD